VQMYIRIYMLRILLALHGLGRSRVLAARKAGIN